MTHDQNLVLSLALPLLCSVSISSAAQPPNEAFAQDELTDDDRQAAADLELVSAIERVVDRSIRRAEKSVVSIARRSTSAHDEQANRDTRPDVIRIPRGIGRRPLRNQGMRNSFPMSLPAVSL